MTSNDKVKLFHFEQPPLNNEDQYHSYRQETLSHLKSFYHRHRQSIEKKLILDKNGLECASNLSFLMDEIIQSALNIAYQSLYQKPLLLKNIQFSILAVGGYGRGMLAPHSDIDLLFILSGQERPEEQKVIQEILYNLWDLKFKIGYSVQTVPDILQSCLSDLHLRTALLEMRFLTGNYQQFDIFKTSFHRKISSLSIDHYINAKLEERDQRLRYNGTSRFLLEPNIKEGKGGLRDLQTLNWIFLYLSITQKLTLSKLISDFIPQNERKIFVKCEEFLWRVRCHRHFISDREGDILNFNMQKEIAARLGFSNRKALSSVERFMKTYYLVVRNVGLLTAYVCAALEARHVKKLPSLNRQTTSLSSHRNFLNNPSLIKDNGRISFSKNKNILITPHLAFRFFNLANHYQLPLHPDALHRILQAHKTFNRNFRNNSDIKLLFLEILLSRSNSEKILRSMNDTGILGWLIPELKRITGLMQFNMYHSYTVEEHSLRAVGALTHLENGLYLEDNKIIFNLSEENRRELYLATLLHDIGKVHAGDHSLVGAPLAKKAALKLGFSQLEAEMVFWLVENHLLMSNTAQRRDLSDPETIQTFIKQVQTRERLKLLYLLTIADMKAVGPAIWTAWKARLLQTLYHETNLALGGEKTEGFQSRIHEKKHRLFQELSTQTEEQKKILLDIHETSYWLKTDTEQQKRHARLIEQAEQNKTKNNNWILTSFINNTGIELTLYAPTTQNHAFLYMSGACSILNLNIISATVFPMKNKHTLYSVLVERIKDHPDVEERKIKQMSQIISDGSSGKNIETLFPDTLKKTKERPFQVTSRITFDGLSSQGQTVLEVFGLDRPGLLYDLVKALDFHTLLIHSAYIATFGEKASDTFYITTQNLKPLQCIDEQKLLRKDLYKVLDRHSHKKF